MLQRFQRGRIISDANKPTRQQFLKTFIHLSIKHNVLFASCVVEAFYTSALRNAYCPKLYLHLSSALTVARRKHIGFTRGIAVNGVCSVCSFGESPFGSNPFKARTRSGRCNARSVRAHQALPLLHSGSESRLCCIHPCLSQCYPRKLVDLHAKCCTFCR